MAKLEVTGAEQLIKQLDTLGTRADKAAKYVVYDGAAVLRNAIVRRMGLLKRDTLAAWGRGRPLNVITQQELLDLIDCLGVSRIGTDDEGSMSVSVSFDGYISRKEKKYPNGVPASLIARSIESGSSARAKEPFMRKAVNDAKSGVDRAMQKALDTYIDNLIKATGGNSNG